MSLLARGMRTVGEAAGKRHNARARGTHVSACRQGGGSLARDARSLAAEASSGTSAAGGEGTGTTACADGLLSAAARLARCLPAATYERVTDAAGAGAACTCACARAAASRREALPAAPSSGAACTPGAVAQHAAGARTSGSGGSARKPWQRRTALSGGQAAVPNGRRPCAQSARDATRCCHDNNAVGGGTRSPCSRVHSGAFRRSTQHCACSQGLQGNTALEAAPVSRGCAIRALALAPVRTATAGFAAPPRASPRGACQRQCTASKQRAAAHTNRAPRRPKSGCWVGGAAALSWRGPEERGRPDGWSSRWERC
jgi:hypothetical protein